MEREHYDEQMRHAAVFLRVEERLAARSIPYKTVHDMVAVAPEHCGTLLGITREVQREMLQEVTWIKGTG